MRISTLPVSVPPRRKPDPVPVAPTHHAVRLRTAARNQQAYQAPGAAHPVVPGSFTPFVAQYISQVMADASAASTAQGTQTAAHAAYHDAEALGVEKIFLHQRVRARA